MGKAFEVLMPDGRKFQVEGPDDFTQEAAIEAVKGKYAEGPSAGEAIKTAPQAGWANLVSSYVDAAAGLAHARAMFSPEQIETFERFPESPAAKEYFQRKAEADQLRRTSDVVRKEADLAAPPGMENSLFARTVHGIATEVPNVVANVGLMTLNPGLGTAAMLTTNAAREAGGTWREGRENGATDEQLARSMGFSGAVSTALEAMLPVGELKRILKEPAKEGLKELAKRAPGAMWKLGWREGAQEGLTSLAQDIEANVSGWGSYSPSDIAARAGESALQGFVLGNVTGATASGFQRVKQIQHEAVKEKALWEIAQGLGVTREQLDDLTGRVIESLSTQKIDPQLAEIQRAQLSGAAAGAPMNPEMVKASQRLDALIRAADEGGVSQDVLARRERPEYQEAATAGADVPTAEHVVLASSRQGDLVGLMFGQLPGLADGSTTVVGGNMLAAEVLFPGLLPDALAQSVQKIADEVGITAPIVLNLTQPKGQTQSWYQTIPLDEKGARFAHVITPRELPSVRHQGGNQNATVDFLGSLQHEIGHALKMERFVRGMVEKSIAAGLDLEGSLVIGKLMDEVKAGDLTDGTLAAVAAFAPTEAELLKNWRDIRQKVLSNDMSAREFIDQWVGPRKMALGMLKTATTASIYDWFHREAQKKGYTIPIDAMSAHDAVKVLYSNPDGTPAFDYVLNFDEFMAEQFARAAHDREYLKGTPLGEWFQSVLDNLRAFFARMKAEGVIKPHVTFEAWLDEQTLRARQLKHGKKWGQVKLTKQLREAQKKMLEEAQKAKLDAALEGKEDVQAESPPDALEEAVGKTAVEETAKMIDDAVQDGIVPPKEEKALRDMLARGQTGAVIDRIWDLRVGGAKPMFDSEGWQKAPPRSYTTKAILQLPNKETLSRDTIRAIAGQQKLKKLDRQALAEVLEKFPQGRIPRDEAIKAILDKNVPLKTVAVEAYGDYGLDRLAWGYRPRGVTLVFEAPFQTQDPKDNHFKNPRYVAHARVTFDHNSKTMHIVELQSDFFNKLTQANLKSRLEYLKEREELILDTIKEYEETLAQLSDQDQQKDLYRSQLQDARVSLAKTVKDIEEIQNKLAAWHSGNTGKLINALQRDDWYQRILREAIAFAAKHEMQYIRFAGPNEVVRVEGWTVKYAPNQKIDIPRPADALEDLVSIATDDVGEPYFLNSKGEEIFPWPEMPRWAVAAARMLDITPPKGQKGIYDWYAKKVIPWMQAELGAQKITDKFHQTWYKINIPENARTILAWDKDNSANPVNPDIYAAHLAGLTNLSPNLVQAAVAEWTKKGFGSQFFQKWFGQSKIKDAVTNEPLRVWRGDGELIHFFDKTRLQWERAFFFTSSKQSAMLYAKGSAADTTSQRLMDVRVQRETQKLREKIETWKGIQREPQATATDRLIAAKARAREEGNLARMLAGAETGEKSPTVRQYFLRMERPLEIDLGGAEWKRGIYDAYIEQAKKEGRDGIIARNVKDPYLSTVYMVFEPEQIKDAQNVGVFGENDLVFFDRTNEKESAIYHAVKQAQHFFPGFIKDSAAAVVWRALDGFTQLQQRALKPLVTGELDVPLKEFMHSAWRLEAYKNSLMQPGETLLRELDKRSKRELDAVYKFLEAERKLGEGVFELQGWNANPMIDQEAKQIWGKFEDGGGDLSAETGLKVKWWTYVPTEKGIALLKKSGIDVDTVKGKELMQLIFQLKQVVLDQFTAHERDMRVALAEKFSATMLTQVEIYKLYEVMQKIRMSPMTPVGRFGNYVLVVKEKVENPKKGEVKYNTVRVEYYESYAEFARARRKWSQAAKGQGDKLMVVSRTEQDFRGVPLQLPRNLLGQLEQTGLYSDEQIKVMSDLLLPAKADKIAVKYEKVFEGPESNSTDVIRNFADFIWHNANYVAKFRFRSEISKAIAAQQVWMREAAKDLSEEGQKLYDELRRNEQLMQRTKEYLLYPPNEMHKIRLWATLIYLAFNIKTVVVNVSTQLNTYAALTMEYGEKEGHYWWVKGAWNAARLMRMRKNQLTNTIEGEEFSAADSEIVWMFNKAVEEGLIDQSYAYFLAGMATTNETTESARQNSFTKVGHLVGHAGMFPFRMVEKMNRLNALTAFFMAERARGAGLQEAYEAAAHRTNLTQGAYDAANRSEFFRGPLALVTMFYTYLQTMVWHMTGGYAKGIRAELANRQAEAIARGDTKLAERLVVKHLAGAHAHTLRLWLMFLMLAGVEGLPMAENIIDLVRALFRKLGWEDPVVQLRKSVKELGWDPNLVMHGVLHNVGGFDLSGSLSLGKVWPATDLVNKDSKSPEEFIGQMVSELGGAPGGLAVSLFKAVEALNDPGYSANTATAVGKQIPGALGALSKAIDAKILQDRVPTAGVLAKDGSRMTESPVGSGEFRDLSELELIGMGMGFQPTLVSENREARYYKLSEQVYWRERVSGLLAARNKAILMENEEGEREAMRRIEEFNDSLEGPYESLRITGKQMADSLKAARKTLMKRENNVPERRFRDMNESVIQAF